MIKNELMDEVIYFSKNKKVIDKSLLRRIAFDEIEQSDESVKDEFYDIVFAKIKMGDTLACTYKNEGIIEYDYDKIIRYEKQVQKKSYLKSNLSMIQVLLHEIEHLREVAKLQNNNLESKLLEISSSEYIYGLIRTYAYKKYKNIKKIMRYSDKQYCIINDKSWEILPKEKIAQLDSYKNLIVSLNNYPSFNKKFFRVYTDFICEYFDDLKMGYTYDFELEQYNSPLIDYLKLLQQFNEKISLDTIGLSKTEYVKNVRNMSIENKMRYGLPITTSDVDKLNHQKKLIKSTV